MGEGLVLIGGLLLGIFGIAFCFAVGLSIIQIPAKLDKLTKVLEKCLEDDGE